MTASGGPIHTQSVKQIQQEVLKAAVMLEYDTNNVLSILSLQLKKCLECETTAAKLSLARDILMIQLDVLKIQAAEAKRSHGKEIADYAVTAIAKWRKDNAEYMSIAIACDERLHAYVEKMLKAIAVALIDGSKLEDFDYVTAMAVDVEDTKASGAKSEESMRSTAEALAYSMTGSHVIADKLADIEAKPTVYDERVEKTVKMHKKDVKTAQREVDDTAKLTSDELKFPTAGSRRSSTTSERPSIDKGTATERRASTTMAACKAAGDTKMDVDDDKSTPDVL
jgi:hypothetical protein